jgi:hypothetical protein
VSQTASKLLANKRKAVSFTLPGSMKKLFAWLMALRSSRVHVGSPVDNDTMDILMFVLE